MSIRKRVVPVTLMTVLMLVTAGCGGDEEEECSKGVIQGEQIVTDEDELAELEGYTETEDDLRIRGTEARDLEDLECLEVVDGTLYVGENSKLENLDGLESLVTVDDHLGISQNPHLEEIDGLSALEEIGGVIEILHNPELENLDGLDNLEELGSNDIAIACNPKLPQCEVEELVERFFPDGGNVGGCCGNLADECGGEPCGDDFCGE